jgi:protein TonB
MLLFTHTHQKPWYALAGVIGFHILAFAAVFLPPQATDVDTQKSIAMEMVLAPVSNTQTKVQTRPTLTPKAAPNAASTKAEQSPTAPSVSTSEATPAAAPTQTTGRAPGAPAFSLPSSEAHGLTNPKPAYPRQSRRLNEQGQVVIRVFVAADGSPQQGEIKTSSGFDRLDQEALRTVMRWRFVPGQRFGTPEAMWFNVPVNFVLE